MTVAVAAQQPIHETHAVAFDGAVDADGHILEPPDLWETLHRPAVPRPGAALRARRERASRSSRSAAQRSMMSRRGFPSTLGAMGDPDLRAMQKDPERTYLRRGAVRVAWTRSERLELLDAEDIDAAILYTTVGLLWEAELEDPELSPGLHHGLQPLDLRVLRRRAAARADRPPVADRSGRRGRASSSGPSARAPRAATSRRSPTTAGRSAIPTTTRCSPPPRTSTCRSPSTRRSSRSGPRARAWGRGRTSSSCGCWRRSPASDGVRHQFTTLFDYGVFDKFPRLKVLVLESGGGWIGYWLDRIDAVYGHTFIGDAGAARAQAERLLPRARLDQLRPRRAHDPGARRALRRRAVPVGVGLPARRPHARVRRRPRRARRRVPRGRSRQFLGDNARALFRLD